MKPPQARDPTTIRHEHSNTAEAQENNLKYNIMKIIEVLKEEMKNSSREIKE